MLFNCRATAFACSPANRANTRRRSACPTINVRENAGKYRSDCLPVQCQSASFSSIMRIWTIGHSTRAIDEFISLLKENLIKLLVDVRAFPGSKRYPQFNKDALKESLTRSWNSLRTFPGVWRQTKIQARLAQHCVAQRVVPRLCRLHGDGAIPKRNRATARRCCGSRPDRDHVRGSSLVALPSLAYRGLPESARSGSAARSRRKQSRAASVHIGGADCERGIELQVVAVHPNRAGDCGQSPLPLTRISDAPEKQTDAAGHVLNSVNKRAIDFHFDRRRRR